MENAINTILQMVTVISCDFEYTVIISMHIQASLAIRSFSKHYGGLSSVHHAAHLFELHICKILFETRELHLSVSVSFAWGMSYHRFFIQDLFIFVTGDPIDNVNQVTSLFLPKDQIIYSSSASSSILESASSLLIPSSIFNQSGVVPCWQVIIVVPP